MAVAEILLFYLVSLLISVTSILVVGSKLAHYADADPGPIRVPLSERAVAFL